MAETASTPLSHKKVLIRTSEAGLLLSDMITVPGPQMEAGASRRVVVAYVNTSAAVKAESDTAAPRPTRSGLVESIPADKEFSSCRNVSGQLRAGEDRPEDSSFHLVRRDLRVDAAVPRPEMDLPAGLHPQRSCPDTYPARRESLCLQGSTRPPGRVGRGAAVIALGFDRRGGVHVSHHDRAGMLGLPFAERGHSDHVGQRTAGFEVRDQHLLIGQRMLAVSAMK